MREEIDSQVVRLWLWLGWLWLGWLWLFKNVKFRRVPFYPPPWPKGVYNPRPSRPPSVLGAVRAARPSRSLLRHYTRSFWCVDDGGGHCWSYAL